MLSTSSASTLTACHGTIRLVKTIGSRIAAQRKTLGLSQGELARLIHRTRSTVSQLEAGTTHDPKPETLLAYAKHLRMSVEYLVTGEVDRTLRVESPELSYEVSRPLSANEQDLIDYLRRRAPNMLERDRLVRTTLVLMQSLMQDPAPDFKIATKRPTQITPSKPVKRER